LDSRAKREKAFIISLKKRSIGLERFMCNSKLRLLFKLIEEKVEEFQRSEFHSFKEFIDEKYKPKKGFSNFAEST
jgi:hypothetical protein